MAINHHHWVRLVDCMACMACMVTRVCVRLWMDRRHLLRHWLRSAMRLLAIGASLCPVCLHAGKALILEFIVSWDKLIVLLDKNPTQSRIRTRTQPVQVYLQQKQYLDILSRRLPL